MTKPEDRRLHPRRTSRLRILWSVLGQHDIQLDRLRDISVSGALVGTEAVASAGEEIRFDLLDEEGDVLATGLARIAWVDSSRGMGVAFLAFGMDLPLIERLVAETTAPGQVRPPPLPAPEKRRVPLPREEDEEPPSAPVAGSDDDALAPLVEPLDVPRPGLIIGIDLGTTNTCVSYVVDGRARIIPGRTGTNTIPSMITFEPDGVFYVGQRAADRQILYPLSTVYGSKRLLGRTYRADLAAALQRHFAFPLGEAEGQSFGLRFEGGVVSMNTIATRVLEEVRSTAEAYLDAPVEAAVITVPAYFSEVQRDAVRDAARAAKLVVHRIVNEPTAAAVAYGHKLKQDKSRVAVWDFGGGTFDFSVVDVSEGRLDVLATGGDNFVGGSDFDDFLASHLLAEFQRAEALSLEPNPQQVARLREAAELAKRALSTQTEYLVELPEFTAAPKRALHVEVTRAEFDALTLPLLERSVAIATDVLCDCGISPADVDDVLLVGGTTRIPAVQKAVAELFGRLPSKRINPDEAVAIGAALLAEEIGSGLTLLDVLPMTVGYGAPELRFTPIVPRNSRLPIERELTLDADLIGAASLPLFQGESTDVSQNEYLCSVVVEDQSLWDDGRVTFRLSFDEHGVMAVETRDAKTGRRLPSTLDRKRSVEDVLCDLGKYDGPPVETWRPPESGLGKVFGRLFKLFRG